MIDVRKSAEFISLNSQHVTIDRDKLGGIAKKIISREYHYPDDKADRPFIGKIPDETARWCLVLDSVHFSFWVKAGKIKWFPAKNIDGYWGMVFALKRAIDEGIPLIDPNYLATLNLKDAKHIFRGEGELPLINERHKFVVQIGQGLRDHLSNSGMELIKKSTGDVLKFIDLVAGIFPRFRDEAVYQGKRVGFYKLAQLLVMDLNITLVAHGIVPFKNLELLTAFADYKIPQLLREEGILVYSPDLARYIDQLKEIPAGDSREIEIRGCMIMAVELLRQELETRGLKMISARLDNILWTEAVARGSDMKPYHRTRTIYY